jgi:endonuclease III related protein
MNILQRIYQELLKRYGPQGWWPLSDLHNSNPSEISKFGSLLGYHPNDYSYPQTDDQRFEVCIGAITTQSTSWIQVEKVLRNLKSIGVLNANGMNQLPLKDLENAVKPAGYFRQKAKKIKIFAGLYLSLKGRLPTRQELLAVWGIGPETADSILLYAYKQPTFVVDTYTKRILNSLGLIDKKATYGELKKLFEDNLESDLKIYQEYHALLVEHAKRYYSKQPYDDPIIKTFINNNLK